MSLCGRSLHAGGIHLSFAIGTAYDMLIVTIFSHPVPPSWVLPDVKLTDAEDMVAGALVDGMLWCAAAQAVAATVALMLPRHHRRLRLVLAYAALSATFATHCMSTVETRILGAAGRGFLGLFCRTIGTATSFLLVVGDLICFLGLVFRGGEA